MKETNLKINGYGMFRTSKTIKESILMFILTLNHTQDTTDHTYGH